MLDLPIALRVLLYIYITLMSILCTVGIIGASCGLLREVKALYVDSNRKNCGNMQDNTDCVDREGQADTSKIKEGGETDGHSATND